MTSHVYAVDLKSHEEILDFVSNASAFIVFNRDANGERGLQYPPENPPHIISTINTCRIMLKQAKVRNAFKTVAEKYSERRLNS